MTNQYLTLRVKILTSKLVWMIEEQQKKVTNKENNLRRQDKRQEKMEYNAQCALLPNMHNTIIWGRSHDDLIGSITILSHLGEKRVYFLIHLVHY